MGGYSKSENLPLLEGGSGDSSSSDFVFAVYSPSGERIYTSYFGTEGDEKGVALIVDGNQLHYCGKEGFSIGLFRVALESRTTENTTKTFFTLNPVYENLGINNHVAVSCGLSASGIYVIGYSTRYLDTHITSFSSDGKDVDRIQ